MADTTVYVGSAGSNVSPYASPATAANLIVTALGELSGVTGDHTVILADEVHTVTGNFRGKNYFDGAGGGAHTIRSTSGDPELCTIQGDDDRLFRLDEEIVPTSFTFQGIRFKKTATITVGSAGALFIQASDETLDVRIKDCILGPVEVDKSSASCQALVRGLAANDATITFDNTRTDGITWNNTASEGVIAYCTAGTEIRFENACSFNEMPITLNRASQFFGVVYVKGGILSSDYTDHQANDITIDNRDAGTGGSGEVANGIFNVVDATSQCNLKRWTFNNVDQYGGGCRHYGLRCEAAFSVGTLIGNGCRSEPETSGTNSGRGLFFAHEVETTDAARVCIGTFDRLESHGCDTSRGGLLYAGGGATVQRGGVLIGRNNSIEGGLVYSGGDGDFDVECYLATGNHFKEDGDDDSSLLFIGIVNAPLTGNTDKTIKLRQFTATDNHAGSGSTFAQVNGNEGSTFTLTTLIDNIAMDNAGELADELTLDETGAGTTHNVTVNNSYIRGGITGSGLVSSLTTDAIETTGGAGLSALGVPAATSLLVGAGKVWHDQTLPRPNTTDQPLPDTGVDIGAVQTTRHPLHPVNL